LAVIRHDFYVGKAKILNAVSGGIAPRGSIFLTDKDTMPLAVALNKEFPLVYAAPKDIENPEEIAKKLAPILKLDAAVIFEKISKKDDPYEILKKKVPDEIVDVVKAEKIKGKPSMVLAHTVKGKGVSFFENKNKYHGVAPNKEELERAIKELEMKP